MALKIESITEPFGKNFDIKKITDELQPWNKGDKITRIAVKNIIVHLYPDMPIFVGGHHVAVHNPITGNRMFIITDDSAPDFN